MVADFIAWIALAQTTIVTIVVVVVTAFCAAWELCVTLCLPAIVTLKHAYHFSTSYGRKNLFGKIM